MAYANLPTYFSSEGLSTIVYILNRVETKAKSLNLTRYVWNMNQN